MKMKLNKSGKIKYVPKQKLTISSMLHLHFRRASFSFMKFGSPRVINLCSPNVIPITE